MSEDYKPRCGNCGQALVTIPVETVDGPAIRYQCSNARCYPEALKVPALLGYLAQAESLAGDIAKACRSQGQGKHAREFYRLRSLLSEAQCTLMIAEEIGREGI